MLLNSFDKTTDGKISRINRYLRENYGFSLSENVDYKSLSKIDKQISNDIYNLKINGTNTKSSPEISKLLIMQEGIRVLKTERQGLSENFGNQQNYGKILGWLVQFVVDNVGLGDDLDDAMTQAMKEYRSSQYRYPDEQIANDCRGGAMAQLQMQERARMRESIHDILDNDQMRNMQAWLVVPGIDLREDTMASLHDHYSQQGYMPGADDDINDWYQKRIVKDFGQDLKEGLVEAAWDEYDKTGRPMAGRNADPKVLDRLLKGSTLSLAEPEGGGPEDDGGQETMKGYTAANRAKLARKPKVGAHDDMSDKAVLARARARNQKQSMTKK